MDTIRRILLCGAGSTGKTTLLNDVIGYLDNVADESNVGRKTTVEMGLKSVDINPEKRPDVFEKLQYNILKRQRAIDERHIGDRTDYISDRSLDPLVYAEVYLDCKAGDRVKQSSDGKYAMQRVKSSLVFLITPHKEIIVSDGIRMETDLASSQHFTDAMANMLEKQNIKFHKITVLDRQQRVEQLLGIIKKVYPELVNN